MLDFAVLAQECAPQVHVDTLRRIVHVESGFNPYAIGVVKGRLQRQPGSLDEAVVTARALQQSGYDFSVGLAQINRRNFERYGLTLESAFEPCANLRAGGGILAECFQRARVSRDDQQAVRAATSCYYSGNFSTGYAHGYVQRVVASDAPAKPIPLVPAIRAVPASEQPTRPRTPSRVGADRPAIETRAPQTAPPPQETGPPAESGARSALLF
ncbi:MAG: transglycosylase SLT domain-containing protein [Burkholderiales bacterium]|nr:transglycosylase SLT domain-containing protein [Burkholderiales bacterium]